MTTNLDLTPQKTPFDTEQPAGANAPSEPPNSQFFSDQPSIVPPTPPLTNPNNPLNEAAVQTINGDQPTNKQGVFRAIFLVLLILTLASAAATTYILLNWNQPTQTTSNALIPKTTTTMKDIQNTEVEINPFAQEAIQDNPFEQSSTDITNIFNEFEDASTVSAESYQNPF